MKIPARTLVVGFGKIGRIKAEIWQSLGQEVHIYDPSLYALTEANILGYSTWQTNILDNLMIDVSSPAGKHVSAIKTIATTLNNPHNILLIEKPMGSSLQEIHDIQMILDAKSRCKSYINESYYSSLALEYVRKEIVSKQLTITSISIELSKNRLIDINTGRFFDYELDVLGIEVPHMLAIYQYLTDRLPTATSLKTMLYKDTNNHENQAVIISGIDNGIRLNMVSQLGDYRVESGNITPGNRLIRTAQIQCGEYEFIIDFDPIDGMPRLHSMVTTNHNGITICRNVIADDHLRNHLQAIHASQINERTALYSSVSNGSNIAKLLIDLRDQSELISINNPVGSIKEGSNNKYVRRLVWQ